MKLVAFVAWWRMLLADRSRSKHQREGWKVVGRTDVRAAVRKPIIMAVPVDDLKLAVLAEAGCSQNE